MAFGIDDAVTGVSTLLTTAIDKIWPNPEDKAKAEAVAMAAAADSAVKQLQAAQAVLLAEASSRDPWTSRARPSFMYVVYALILSSVPFSVLFAFEPDKANAVVSGFRMWLAAIPDAMWQTFTVGYLGYTVARSGEKSGGLMPMITGRK